VHRKDHGFLHEVRRSLYTAVLSDVLDELGFPDQAMPSSIRPLDENLTLAGFARSGLYREVFHAIAGENPYALEIALVDSKGRGKVAEIDTPIGFGGIAINPGDLVVGDADGVVVVPQSIEDEALRRAFANVAGENTTRDELAAGAKLADVFAKYGCSEKNARFIIAT